MLIVKMSYRVRCLNCGFRGQAHVGKEPISATRLDGKHDVCPVCNHFALIGDNRKESDDDPKEKSGAR